MKLRGPILSSFCLIYSVSGQIVAVSTEQRSVPPQFGWLVHGCKTKPLVVKKNENKNEGSEARMESEKLLFLTSDICSPRWI